MILRRWYRHAACVGCAVLAGAVALLIGRPIGLDGPLLDLLIKAREIVSRVENESKRSPVAVIALDGRSLDAPELAPYPRALMAPVWAAVLDSVFQAGARAVGFDLLFTYNANQFSPNFDAPFLAALAKHREQIVLARSATTLPAASFLAALRNDEGALGLAELTVDPDGRHRRIRATYETAGGGTLPGLASALLRRARGPRAPSVVVLAPRYHPERIPTYAVVDVLRCATQAPEALALAFAGKIVLVGSVHVDEDRQVSSARFLEPMRHDTSPSHSCGLRRLAASDPDSASVPGVFLHAAAIDVVMTGHAPSMPPPVVISGLSAGAALGGAALGFLFSPWLALGIMLLIAVAAFCVAGAALAADVWIPMALPLIALVVASVFAYVVRYLVEERTRRWIQQAFSHYLSPSIVERLAADPASLRLGGERREVTVMFADLSGFTALSGTVEPEVLTRLTNQYLGYIVEQVEVTGGYVDKFIGDAVLAIWGAPAADTVHATHGIRAALAAVARIQQEGDAARARGDRAFSVKIGLNSGPAVVGNVGTNKRYNYTAVGETVNVAARLESVPSLYGCQVVIGPRTAELARDDFLLRELDWIKVKGGQGPIAIFEPLVERVQASPEQVDAARRFAEALAHYRAARFAKAHSIWETLAREESAGANAVRTGHGPAATMAARALALAAHPPAEPWDGVSVLASK